MTLVAVHIAAKASATIFNLGLLAGIAHAIQKNDEGEEKSRLGEETIYL